MRGGYGPCYGYDVSIKRDKRINLWLSIDEYHWIVRQADIQAISMTSVLKQLIRIAMRKAGPDQKPDPAHAEPAPRASS